MKLKLLFGVMLFTFFGANSQTSSDPRFRMFESPNLNPCITAKVTKTDLPSVKETKASEPKRVEGENCQVDLYLDFDPSGYRFDGLLIWDGEKTISQWDLDLYDDLISGSNIISIPQGTYDIMVTFVKYGLPPISLNVVKEQVIVDQNMQLSFNPDEAKNHIHFQSLTIDGEPVATNKYAYDEENDNYTLIENGNTDEVFFVGFIILDGKYFVGWDGNFGNPIEGVSPGGELNADVFINDVSERFTFYNYRVATGFDYDVYTSSYEVKGASGDVTVTNNPSKFLKFDLPLTSVKHQGEEVYLSFEEMAYYTDYNNNSFGAGRDITFIPAISEGEMLKLYLSASIEDSQAGFYPIIEPSLSIKTIEQIVTPWGDVWEQERFDRVMQGIYLTVSDGKIVFANNGVNTHQAIAAPWFNIEFSEEVNGNVDYRYYPLWPTHPAFTYSVDKKKDQLGDNCPLLVTNPMQYTAYNMPFGGVFIDKNFVFNYIGRYGEIKPDDVDDTQVKIQVNGEDFYEAAGPITAPLDDMNGVVDVTFNLGCTTVDELPATNNTLLHYTIESDNSNPPTMTMLHFKDSNDDVTDHFDSADEGTIEFSAGDFNLVTTPMGYLVFDRQAPATVEVSYAPYGTEDWNELPVEELPEYYWPVMGWFYRGSLASVTGQAEKGWFDLKFRLVDEAGNWQEQVVSPAFRIDDLAYTSVANVGCDNAREVARYSIDGKRVDASHRGVTIIKLSDGTAKKIIQ